MTTKLGKTIRDVFSGTNFGSKGDLTEMFKVEYRNEYRNMTKSHINVTDKVVKDYLGL